MTKRDQAARARVRRKTDIRRTKGGPVADFADPVSLSEAVALTGLSERTLRRKVKAGELLQRREGRRSLLSRAGVVELAARLGRPVAEADPMADNGGQRADTASRALAPILEQQREENRALVGAVLDLNRQLDESRKLLTAGEAEASRELVELRDRAARAETARRWALILAGAAGAVAVALAVALVVGGA